MYKAVGLLCRCIKRKKRVKTAAVSKGGGRLRDLYKVFFENFHILPSEVAKQPPFILFEMLDTAEDEEEEIPDNLKWFYGE